MEGWKEELSMGSFFFGGGIENSRGRAGRLYHWDNFQSARLSMLHLASVPYSGIVFQIGPLGRDTQHVTSPAIRQFFQGYVLPSTSLNARIEIETLGLDIREA